MIQMICRWKDIDETQLFHVEPTLIPYGLRAVLKLAKSRHSVFRDTKIVVGQKNALLQTENRTAIDSQVNFMISFCRT